MSSPAAVVRICGCGHPERLHSDEFGCDNSACGCSTFRQAAVGAVQPVARPIAPPDPRPAAPVHVEQPHGLTAAQIIAVGRTSPTKSTAALAAKIEGQLVDLAQRVRAEREATAERQRRQAAVDQAGRDVERLERELSTARRRLTAAKALLKHRTPPAAKDAGDHPCQRDGCDRSFATSQARAMHERRAHDGFDPNSAKAS